MQTKWTFEAPVPQMMDGQSLRHLLHQHWLLPKHLIFSLRSNKRVLVNGHYLPVNFPVHDNDKIEMTFLPADFRNPFPNVIPDSAANLEILYEDHNLIVVNKRRGDKTHPNQPGEVGATINHLAAYLATQDTLPYMIHRLDQETSGAILFAKNPVVVPPLIANLAAKRIQRTYLAWVTGTKIPPQGTIELPIGRDPQDRRKRKVNGVAAVPALTHYQVIQNLAGDTLLAIQLATGRTHQIRVHFAAIGHPLVGDPLYAPDDKQPFLLLHSWKITLPLPFSEKAITVTAPLPPHFTNFRSSLLG